jgi:hypothetical protein
MHLTMEIAPARPYHRAMDEVTDNARRIGPPSATGASEDALDRWLVEEVVPVFDAMKADPGRGIAAKQVTATLDTLHAQWLKKAGRGA